MSENKKLWIGPQMHSALSHTILYRLDIFGDLRSMNNIQDHGLSVKDATFDHKF